MSSRKDSSRATPAPRRVPLRGRCASIRLRRAYDYARALCDELRALSAPADDAARWTPHLAEVQRLLETLERAPSSTARSEGPTPAQLRTFGQLLRDRRNAAGLSRGALARKALLSDATIKFIETARHPPSRATLIRLVGVAPLGLTWDDVAGLAGAAEPPVLSSPGGIEDGPPERTRWFLADDFDWLRLVTERDRLLRGPGGYVPAQLAYVDPHNAIEYLAYLNHCATAGEPRAALPLDAMAQKIAEQMLGARLQILALGAGEGTIETRLVHALSEHLRRPELELWLIDQSLPLLCVAHQRAVAALGTHPAVRLRFLAEDLVQLARHAPLAAADAERPQRLFVLLGGTLAELDPETRFLRHGLVGSAPGDLLLLDVEVALAPPDKPDEIRRRERLLKQPVPAPLREWLATPFWRADRGVCAVDLTVALDTQGVLPGSYALSVVARVQSSTRPERCFTLPLFKRYDPEALAAFLGGCGWERVTQLAYGQGSRHMAILFRRCADERR
ncbi:MAG: helix-turn-helix transcriptional regulator [Polyangia bacterium]